MSRAKRKAAAERFRRNIARSNALHRQYLNDRQLLEDYDRFATWQLRYLLGYFDDLYKKDGYYEALDFIMSDLAGVGIAGRDRDLERVAPVITSMLPVRALETIATAAEMNARVLQINIDICRCLRADNMLPDEITEAGYIAACRDATTFDDCAELTHLIVGLGRTLESLVEMPILGGLLRAMRGPAHAAGFGALQEFLETGYFTFRQIPDVDSFLTQIEGRMIGIFKRIFKKG